MVTHITSDTCTEKNGSSIFPKPHSALSLWYLHKTIYLKTHFLSFWIERAGGAECLLYGLIVCLSLLLP